MGFNPVAKNLRNNKGGPHTPKDKEGRTYINQKIKKELDELDEDWIKEEITEYQDKRDPDR